VGVAVSLPPCLWLSFAQLTDATRHREFNEWHQLDHVPENRALDGVIYGDRFAHSPACAAATTADPVLAGIQYMTLYFLRPPARESIAEWHELSDRSFQWGRRPDIGWVERPLMGFFSLVKTYVSPRVPVSAEALPFRPSRGLYLTAHRIPEPRGVATHELYRRYDREVIPSALEHPGVAGAYSAISESTSLDPGYSPARVTTFDPSEGSYGHIRVHLYPLDGDPVEIAPALEPPIHDEAELLFAGPLETIRPWDWSWFD
jgi:hypothetical protein